MNDGVVRRRTAAHLEELKTLEVALGAKDASAGSAELAGRLLATAGALLRRTHEGGVAIGTLESALRRLPSAAVKAWVEGVDLAGLEARLRRASEEAVEAMLPESPEDRETWIAWAREGVEARERIEGQLIALRFRETLGFQGESTLCQRLAQQLELQDRALRMRSRWLVGLNAWRREERDALDAEHRATAWWFSDRADCDDLIALLSGELNESRHLERCEHCQRDLARVEAVNAAHARHVSADELWNYDLGLCSAQERAFIEKHSRACGECAQALAALAEGEEAIRDLDNVGTAPGVVVSMDRARAKNASGEAEVVADHDDFRVLLFRRRDRMKLVVQPRRAGRVAAAAVYVADAPERALAARQGPDGLELDISDSLRVRGGVTVRVRLQGSAQDVEHDVAF